MLTCWVTATYTVIGSHSIETIYCILYKTANFQRHGFQFYSGWSCYHIKKKYITIPHRNYTLPTHQNPNYTTGSRSKCPHNGCSIAKAAGFQHQTPRKFLLSSRKSSFLVRDWAKDFNMRPPRKINVGFVRDSRKRLFNPRRMAVCGISVFFWQFCSYY